MENFGFYKTALAIPFAKVGDVDFNKNITIELIKEAALNKAALVVFPELSITSYTCQDMFFNKTLIEESVKALFDIATRTKDLNIIAIIGLPVFYNNCLYNCGAFVYKGEVLGIVPKIFIPNYHEFYESRWFASGETIKNSTIIINGKEIPFGTKYLFRNKNNPELTIGMEICEDLWTPLSPSTTQALNGATILCNLSASNVLVGKNEYRNTLIKSQSAKTVSAYLYASTGMGESTTDTVFDGSAFVYENGIKLAESERFLRKNQIIYADVDVERLTAERSKMNTFHTQDFKYQFIDFEQNIDDFNINRYVDPRPFVPESSDTLDLRCEEVFHIQSASIARRIETLPGIKAVIGMSGGLDSTLAFLVLVKAFKLLSKPLSDIVAVTMPGFGTTSRTYNNAMELCKRLGVEIREIDIKDMSKMMFDKIGHDENEHTTVYENVQARARTYILMSVANKVGGMVVGTGDLSEIALGWATYNADHISMYNPNSSIPKTLVKFLIQWVSKRNDFKNVKEILESIFQTPVSPELLPHKDDEITQITEDHVGPYELHDFFIYNFVKYGFSYEKIFFLAKIAFKNTYEDDFIKKWLDLFYSRFFSNQWKRDCVPAGPKVGSIDLSPRSTWRMATETEKNFFKNK